jgi:truncated hemoglobin YjbI
MTALEQLGGEAGVRAHVAAFVARVVADPIIGFWFAGRDIDRIVRHECEHALMLWGAEVEYTGRPLGTAHKPLGIHAGHFRRRLAILRTVLQERGVEEELVARWVRHDERMMGAIVRNPAEDCSG